MSDWAAISVQGRWQGVIFAGDRDARIVPIVRPANNLATRNAQWSVQSKGCLINQKLKGNKGGGKMIVWMSNEGLGAPAREDGVVFVEAEGNGTTMHVMRRKVGVVW